MVEDMPSDEPECVLVEETRFLEEDPVGPVFGRLQQPVAEPGMVAGIGGEKAWVDNDEADDASVVQDLSQPGTERTDSPLDLVVARPVPVPPKAQGIDCPGGCTPSFTTQDPAINC